MQNSHSEKYRVRMEAAQRQRMTLYCLGFSGSWSLSATLETKGALSELQGLPLETKQSLEHKTPIRSIENQTAIKSNQTLTLMSSSWNSYLL